MARTSDYKTIWNLPVGDDPDRPPRRLRLRRLHEHPIDTSTGQFTHTDLVNDGAIGLELQNVNLGMEIMDETGSLVPITAGTLSLANLRFFALQATADSLGLIGVPEIQLNAVGASRVGEPGHVRRGMALARVDREPAGRRLREDVRRRRLPGADGHERRLRRAHVHRAAHRRRRAALHHPDLVVRLPHRQPVLREGRPALRPAHVGCRQRLDAHGSRAQHARSPACR